MSAVEKVIAEIQEETKAARQQSHSLTVALTSAQHDKLVKLSEHLQIAKTNLAARLLSAAIDEADTRMFPKGIVYPAQHGSSSTSRPSPRKAPNTEAGAGY